MEFTSIPGEVKFLNKANMPSENFVVCAAIVGDVYDEVTTPEVRHWKLLEEMLHSGHFSCLDHCAPTFKVKAPIFVARQILRSSGFSFNEISGRYKEVVPKFYKPDLFFKDVKRKELGKVGELLEGLHATYTHTDFEESVEGSWETYLQLLARGCRKEQARMVLPVTTFTEFWMTAKLSDYYHFLNLRLDSHAQAETRYIAQLILAEIEQQFPKITEYWKKYAKGPLPSGCIQTP